jgi:predicted metal-dependent phosphoesterase TrpH
MKVDLHLHSTASDGRLSPQELVSTAASLGVEVIAITDHDSVEGVAPALLAAEEFPTLKIIPGVEISTDVPHGEIHILGYFIDYRNLELSGILERLRNSRQVRAQKMLVKLANMGIRVEWERVQELAGGGSIGRPHIAQAMLERGYVLSPKEAFIKYIGREGPAYVEREKMTPPQAVELVVKADGLAVLAHPSDINDLEELISHLQRVGLAGIEAYYNGYPPKTMKYLASLAHKYGLIASGGSDYHGIEGSGGTLLGGVEVPDECIEQLFVLAGRRAILTR